MKKSDFTFLFPLAPALVAVFDVEYIPRLGIGHYQELLDYLQFHAYLFLMLFCIAGLVSIFLILYQRPSWLTAVFGTIVCLVPINVVFLWSAMPENLPQLDTLFYTETEDYQHFFINTKYDWLTLCIILVIAGIWFAQGFALSRHPKISRRAALGAIYGTIALAVAIFPLSVDVYLFDPSDIQNHVTNIFLSKFTNADLLYSLILILGLSLFLAATLRRRLSGPRYRTPTTVLAE